MTDLIRQRLRLADGTRYAPGMRRTFVWCRDNGDPGSGCDLDVLDEIEDDIYGLRGLPTDTWPQDYDGEGATVVDIGACFGAFTLAAMMVGAHAVVAVEPDPANVALLQKNLDELRGTVASRIEVITAAVGAGRGSTSLYGSAAQAHVTNAPGPAVELLGFDDILGLVDGRIGLLKIDCEGSEYAAIAGASAEALARCEHVVMEWHGQEMAPWRDDWPIGLLVGKLLETHDCHVYGMPSRGGMLHAHAYPKD